MMQRHHNFHSSLQKLMESVSASSPTLEWPAQRVDIYYAYVVNIYAFCALFRCTTIMERKIIMSLYRPAQFLLHLLIYIY